MSEPINVRKRFEWDPDHPTADPVRVSVEIEQSPRERGEPAEPSREHERPIAEREREIAEQPAIAPPAAVEPIAPAAAPAVEKTAELIAVEQILEEHLSGVFEQLPPDAALAFKRKGEETASKVAMLLSQVAVKVNEILSLIRSWLSMLPGVNRFFIEQESKIKTDKLLAWREAKRRREA